MNWDELQDRWPELKRTLRDNHPDLDTDALEQTPQGRQQLMQLIDAKYGAAQPRAEEDLDALLGNRDDDDKA